MVFLQEFDVCAHVFCLVVGECQQAAAEADTPEEREELKPSAITYINLINACEQCGRLDRAFDVFGGARHLLDV